MMTEQTKAILTILEAQVRQTKAAYYAGTAGIGYDDMAAAARRLLEMRAAYEKASGRKVTTKVTKRAIATILRAA